MTSSRPKCWALAAALLLPGLAVAHGEEDPGPHGGEIRMPGAFHVEALAREDALVVYLLDMQFERPRVADSSVSAVLEQDGDTTELTCRSADDLKAFRCALPKEATLARGKLAIEATRAGKPADTARYELPLAWSDTESGTGE